MSNVQATDNTRNFTLSTEMFQLPQLDLYSQMVYIVLKAFAAESSLPTLAEIAKYGRMTAKQATKALQSLTEQKLVSHKLFRQIVGEFADDRLSWAAKGLLAYCKEHPHVRMAELQELSGQSGEDEHGIRKALKELRRHGYLEEYPELIKLATG
ncbi:hypothetical protein [Paenibacillus flagellatus]|uniref:Uncharacterized protein n=1 Tax=Paenibacillus flagellatus TaxID=2211139 RepID=A0A2V5K021_9BACL|nr:hypothetical protein [Paenibacillus flagellatus]PYI52509.1 hypothetical protein DLM86_20245 [Paenibacillus flagellatus]